MDETAYQLGRRPALDGLRGAAVVAVVIEHTLPRQQGSSGTVGVTMFFVLSGFLITRLLLEEGVSTGKVNLGYFWARRVARLVPGLSVYLLAVAAAMLAASASLFPVLASATYLSNVAAASGKSLGVLGHMWSLSMEEQFYLLWPLAVIGFLRWRPKSMLPALLLSLILAVLWRWYLVEDGAPYARIAFAPDTRLDALLLGCILAVVAPALLRCGNSVVRWAAGGGAILLVVFSLTDWLEYSAATWVVALAACTVVWWAASAPSGVALRLSSAPPLAAVGVVSYGVYLWHDPIAHIAGRSLPLGAAIPVAMLSALMIATLSWRCVEKPLRRLILAAYVSRRKAESEGESLYRQRPNDRLISRQEAPES